MNVGITIGFEKINANKPYNIYANGLRQHIFFFYDTLKNIGIVDNVWIVNVGDISYKEQQLPNDLNYEIRDFDEIKDNIQVLFELGMEVSVDRVKYIKENGCKFVGYGAGNSYVLGIEKILFSNQTGSLVPRHGLYDEFWTNKQHMNTNKHYWETTLKTKVKCLPHIWSPKFIDGAKKFEGFKDTKPYIAILEPNINVVKTFVYPLLICEKVHELNPDLIRHVFVTNAFSLKERPLMKRLFNSLKLFSDSKVSAEARFKTENFLNTYGDIIVSHQWENGLNYLYYELLYLNYPLVHNSPFLKNVGYYYPEFNAELGAKQLIKAITEHFEIKKEYNKRCDEYIYSINPDTQTVIDDYTKAILKLKKP
jgi:hypothetical protein